MNLVKLNKYVEQKTKEYPEFKKEFEDFNTTCIKNCKEEIESCLDSIDELIKLKIV